MEEGKMRHNYARSAACAHHHRIRHLCAREGALVGCGLLPPCDASIWSSGGKELGAKWPDFKPQGSSGSCASWDLSSYPVQIA